MVAGDPVKAYSLSSCRVNKDSGSEARTEARQQGAAAHRKAPAVESGGHCDRLRPCFRRRSTEEPRALRGAKLSLVDPLQILQEKGQEEPGKKAENTPSALVGGGVRV